MTKLLRVPAARMTSNEAYLMYHLRQRLNSMLNSLSGVETVMLYFWQNGYCVQPQRALALPEFYNSVSDSFYAPASYEKMLGLMDASMQGGWTSMDNIAGVRRLYFHMTLPSLTGLQQATLILPIKTDYLASILQTGQETVALYLLSGADGHVLYSTGKTVALPSALPEGDGWQMEVGRFLLSCRRLKNTGDLVLYAADLNEVMAPLRAVQRLSLLGLAVALILCAALTFFVSVRNFNPIRQLVDLLPTDEGDPADEYMRLKVALMEGVEEREQLLWHVTLDKQRRQDEALYKKLCATRGLGQLAPEGFKGQACAVRVTLIDFTGDAANAQALVRQALMDGAGPVYAPVALCIGMELLAFFFIPDSPPDAYNALCRVLRGTLQYLRGNKAMECAAILTQPSDVQSASLSAMSREIEEALARRKNEDSLTVCDPDTGENGKQAAMALTAQRLFTASREGNRDAVALLLKTLGSQSAQLIGDAQLTPDEGVPDGDSECLKKTIGIVSRQCADPMLSVGAIADAVGKTPDALSRLFKKQMMMGLLDYIHHTRVSLAKEMRTTARVVPWPRSRSASDT